METTEDAKDFKGSRDSEELLTKLVKDINPENEKKLRRSVSKNFEIPEEKSLLEDDNDSLMNELDVDEDLTAMLKEDETPEGLESAKKQ